MFLVVDERVDRWTEGHGKVHVHTARQTYEADRLLVATGAWTNRLLGLPDSPLTPKRVPVHWVEAPKDRSFHLSFVTMQRIMAYKKTLKCILLHLS